jgi:hypothetical protein
MTLSWGQVRAYYRVLGPWNTAAVVGLAAVSMGCAMERLSLRLIVTGAFLARSPVWSHQRGAPES